MSNSHLADRRPLRSIIRCAAPFVAAACVLGAPAVASAQIKQPGAHNKYVVELEPHFVFDWGYHYGRYYDNGDAIGVGMRATIPFLQNGPISTINNNMGIGFGLDWAHNGNACGGYYYNGPRRYYYGDCSYDIFHIPIVVQWNFFLTPIVSVFGEAGLGIYHFRGDVNDLGCDPRFFDCTYDHTGVEFLFWGGGRFQFGEKSPVSGIVRLGWPYLSLGIGIMI